LPAAGEVPYVIERSAIDPITRTLAFDQGLSEGTISTATWTTGTTTVTLTAATPAEGAGTYRVSAIAPLYTDGSLSTLVSMPASGATAPVTVTLPTLAVASGATSGSLSVAVTKASTNTDDAGVLLVTHDGAVIGAAPLDAALKQGSGTVTVSNLPAGGNGAPFGSAVYYLSVRTWQSSNPAGQVHRQWYSSAVNLSTGSLTTVPVTID
jgi:hypothetical protein